MVENEGMEGKDLAKDKKQEFEARILEEIKDLKTGENTTSIEGIEVTNTGAGYTINYKGIIFGLIDKEGKFQYNSSKFKEVKAKLEEEGKTLEDIGLPELDQSIDQEKEPEPEAPEQLEEEREEEPEDEQEDKEDKPEEDIEKDKERIAKELEIDPKKVFPIRQDSSFYEKHLGMFGGRNLFFYEDKYGKIKVGTLDENGKPVEDTEHFSSVDVGQMAQVIRLGDGRENVRREIPIQMIGIKNPAKQNGKEDVQDRYLAVYIGETGELEFEEVEQSSKTGELVSTRIEIAGRDYNTEAMNERIQDRGHSQTPGQTAEHVKAVEEREHSDKDITTDEVHADNDTFYKQLQEDITKTYGPMPKDKLDEMTKKAMELIIENREDRKAAIAKVGIKEREQGGRARGENFNLRTGE